VLSVVFNPPTAQQPNLEPNNNFMKS
jgi:hypothetical protein